MDQRNENACGAHKLGEAIPNSYFDYTCDDCMLPYNHKDPEDDPNFKDDKENNKKRNKPNKKHEKTQPF